MMSDLSILCVTRAEPEIMALLRQLVSDAHSLDSECILAADGEQALVTLNAELSTEHHAGWFKLGIVHSKGYVESVLDDVVEMASGNYVLRIDDDERMSRGMVGWLRGKHYETGDVWKFARAHLVCDEQHYIENLPLFPDHQTRLSVRHKAGGRRTIHCGSPFGGGELAPVVIEHWKFLVKSLAQRQEIVARYERCQPGAGSDFVVFSTPELVIPDLQVAPLSDALTRAAEDVSVAR